MIGRTKTKGRMVRLLCECPDFRKELSLILKAKGIEHTESEEGADLTIIDLRTVVEKCKLKTPILALVDQRLESRERALEWKADLSLAVDDLGSLVDSVNGLLMSSQVRSERILVLEDCQIQRDFVTHSLRRKGWQVRACGEPEDFLRELRDYSPDLVLLDFELGGDRSGADICRIIRNDALFRRIPIAFMTASERNVSRCYKAGGNRVLIKEGSWTRDLTMLSRELLPYRMDRIERLDRLTGCLLRREAGPIIERLKRMGGRENKALSVSVIDIDHFKSVNDTYGHQAGDEVLRAFGRALSSHFREEDIVCRWGGEEFLVVAYNLSPELTRSRLTEFAEGLKKLSFQFSPSYRIKFTAGVAQVEEQESTESALSRADQALYLGKTSGRNRVEISDSKSDPEIVLIEDDEDFATLVKLEAEERGITVRHYSDAESALKNWNKNASGYLIDWDLPGMSGTDFMEELPSSQRDKMVLMSAFLLPEVKEKARKMGFGNCLEKPKAMGGFFEFVDMPKEA